MRHENQVMSIETMDQWSQISVHIALQPSPCIQS
ncbi:Uncharacterised protein [Bordetella pertussis]|nr:Uncharacterised protein [Bordetella pertussis]